MSEQTAVEWLVSYMTENFHLTDEALLKFKEAKEMERQQLKDAAVSIGNITGEQYYNQTFKK
jgi:hypothetical protein